MTTDYTKDLEQFDDAFAPKQGITNGLEALADGAYDFTILNANISTTKNSGTTILRLEIKCEQLGSIVEKPYFMTGQEQIDRLGGDLATLGFPAGTWNKEHGKKFSVEMAKAIDQLPGLRFKGTKKTNPNKSDPSKPYHNLYINAPLPKAGSVGGPVMTPDIGANSGVTQPANSGIPF